MAQKLQWDVFGARVFFSRRIIILSLQICSQQFRNCRDPLVPYFLPEEKFNYNCFCSTFFFQKLVHVRSMEKNFELKVQNFTFQILKFVGRLSEKLFWFLSMRKFLVTLVYVICFIYVGSFWARSTVLVNNSYQGENFSENKKQSEFCRQKKT